MNKQEQRALACKTLLDAGIRRLPVHVKSIAQYLGASVFTYEEYAKTVDCPVAEVAQRYGNDGFTQRIGNKTAIFYYESGNMRRVRWTIAHEIAHILLGHLSGGGGEDADTYADAVAAELLCPSAVAAACVCYYPGEISRLCDISLSAACRRARELASWQGETVGEEDALLLAMSAFLEEQEQGGQEREAIFATLPTLQSHRM